MLNLYPGFPIKLQGNVCHCRVLAWLDSRHNRQVGVCLLWGSVPSQDVGVLAGLQKCFIVFCCSLVVQSAL